MESREMTFGEKRVQRNFNPTANQQVEELKTMYASIIDKLETLKNEKSDNGNKMLSGEYVRVISLAQTELETSCMYAVKSLFI
jgi:hypothetical protein